MLKARMCRVNGWEVIELDKIPSKFEVVGHMEDLSEFRAKGVFCHREELDNAPFIYGYVGPMWDGDMLRYETPELYEMLSN